MLATQTQHLVVELAEQLLFTDPGSHSLFECMQRGLADRSGLFQQLDFIDGLDDASSLDRGISVGERPPL